MRGPAAHRLHLVGILANAVKRAHNGVRIDSLPMKPDRIMAALKRMSA